MNKIDRLLREIKRMSSPSVHSALCIIDRDDMAGKWIAKPCLWDGVPGSGFRPIPADWKIEYDTADEAAEAANRLFASLNISNPDRVVIIVDDVGALED